MTNWQSRSFHRRPRWRMLLSHWWTTVVFWFPFTIGVLLMLRWEWHR